MLLDSSRRVFFKYQIFYYYRIKNINRQNYALTSIKESTESLILKRRKYFNYQVQTSTKYSLNIIVTIFLQNS
jgi:hypothetical protein